jgi:hypothetical protein
MADFDVKKLKTPADCRNFMKNARQKVGKTSTH